MTGRVTQTPVGEYLRNLASTAAVPGGGSAAALAGAMGAALLAMVARVSARRAGGGEIQADLGAIALECGRLSDRLAELSQEDIDAYAAVLRAKKAAPDTPGRDPEIARALETAARVPLSTATLAHRGFDLLDQLRPMAWRPMSSDVETARCLMVAAFLGGLANVAVNLPELSVDARQQVEKAYRALKGEG